MIFFDFCGTLTATNNTFDFIFYYLKNKKKYLKLIFFFILDTLNIFKNFIFFINKRKWELLIRKKVFLLLKAEKKKDIYKYAKFFAQQIFVSNFYNKKYYHLIKKIGLSRSVYILSASISPVLEEFTKDLPVKKVFASKMRFNKKNLFTGHVDDYLFNKKQLILKNFKKSELKKSTFYTDNKEDEQLKEFFGNFIKVNSLKKNFNKASYTSTINLNNYQYTYFPGFYYILSRPLSIFYFLLNELFIFFLYFRSLDVLLYYFFYLLIFLPIYEVSSFVNDYYSVKKEVNPTIRIEKKVKMSISLFIALRIFYLILIIYFLKFLDNLFLSLIISLVILIIGLYHSFLKEENRKYTMVILRLIKLLPFYFLVANKISFATFFFLSFIIHFFPVALYVYDKEKNLTFDFIKKSLIFYLLLSIFFVFFDFYFLLPPIVVSLLLRYLSFWNYLRKV